MSRTNGAKTAADSLVSLAGMGFLLAVFILGIAQLDRLKAIKEEAPNNNTHISEKALLDGALKVAWTEKIAIGSLGDRTVSHFEAKYTFTKPGSYLVEEYVQNYRDHDTLGERRHISVSEDQAPYTLTVKPKFPYYRLEATTVNPATLEMLRDTAEYRYHGNAGGAFLVTGHPVGPR